MIALRLTFFSTSPPKVPVDKVEMRCWLRARIARRCDVTGYEMVRLSQRARGGRLARLELTRAKSGM